MIRIKLIYAYIYIMKTRVNLTIEQDTLDKAKNYASKIGVSISGLVEDYLNKITAAEQSKEIKTKLFEIVNELPKTSYPENYDFQKQYFEDNKEKYGF
ncbi:hypothetical protein Pedsa_2836 [Pseudopedobacter saltans DSM 12145]|uniref:Uncharacterized protein n=2 Tax=Pseudopedobacter saltans TaxID=151895 RepID=F0S8B3_PSESL|nr:hypothetical protein Pedsa_2836 [Pseudopedobacter saltans DSM 12145]